MDEHVIFWLFILLFHIGLIQILYGLTCIYKKKHNLGGEKRYMERFEIYKDKKDEWRFRLRAPNGEIIAASEGYHNKQDCIHGINTVKEYSQTAEIKEL